MKKGDRVKVEYTGIAHSVDRTHVLVHYEDEENGYSYGYVLTKFVTVIEPETKPGELWNCYISFRHSQEPLFRVLGFQAWRDACGNTISGPVVKPLIRLYPASKATE